MVRRSPRKTIPKRFSHSIPIPEAITFTILTPSITQRISTYIETPVSVPSSTNQETAESSPSSSEPTHSSTSVSLWLVFHLGFWWIGRGRELESKKIDKQEDLFIMWNEENASMAQVSFSLWSTPWTLLQCLRNPNQEVSLDMCILSFCSQQRPGISRILPSLSPSFYKSHWGIRG